MFNPMTPEEIRAHDRYTNPKGGKIVTEAVDDAYLAARRALESYGFGCANDDRAERLIAALQIYLEGSADDQG